MLEAIRPAPQAIRAAVKDALTRAGCPSETADRIADDTTVEQEDGVDRICLYGACVDDASATSIESLVENVVADNAEAHDRGARGETDAAPLWPLPGRRSRH